MKELFSNTTTWHGLRVATVHVADMWLEMPWGRVASAAPPVRGRVCMPGRALTQVTLELHLDVQTGRADNR